MLTALKNSFDFKGRATRSEYWSFVFFDIIFSVLLFVLEENINRGNGYYDHYIISPVVWLYLAITLIARISVLFRRLHDIGSSFAVIPFVIIVTVIVAIFFNYFSLILVIGTLFALMRDSDYDNEYDLCPKGYGPKPVEINKENQTKDKKEYTTEGINNKKEELDKVISKFKSSGFGRK